MIIGEGVRALPLKRFKVIVCKGPTCGDQRNSAALHDEFATLLQSRPPERDVVLERYSCFGRCTKGPNVLVREVKAGENTFMLNMMPNAAPGAVIYCGVKLTDCERIVDQHIDHDTPVEDLREPRPVMPVRKQTAGG
jgi:(2Fe-2S) ferredoxin